MALVSAGSSTAPTPVSEVATTTTPASITSSSPVTPTPATPLPPPSDDTAVDVIHIPSYSRWFSWDKIHECEVKFLPEFFDGRKNPRAYVHYRNAIIKRFRQNPSSKITFTEIRKTLVGDVGSIRRVFDFLDAWGLINYFPSTLSKSSKWDDKDSKSATDSTGGGAGGGMGSGSAAIDSSLAPSRDSSKRICNGCKSVCSIACFACDKYDLTLCARCYVRGNYRVGVSSSDFRRVEINEEVKADWSNKETMQLLEAIMHYGDDWKRVAQHVGGKNERDCIAQFLKLPCGEEYSGYVDLGEVDNKFSERLDHTTTECALANVSSPPSSKRICLTPLADASNPIMAQAAFISALVGVGLAEAAAQGAVRTLTGIEYGASRGSAGSLARNKKQQEAGVVSSGDNSLNALEKACLDANELLEKEEADVERAVYRIAEVKMKEIQDKIKQFEELDLQTEKEWQQLEQMKNLLFVDQLAYSFHKRLEPKTVEPIEDKVREN